MERIISRQTRVVSQQRVTEVFRLVLYILKTTPRLRIVKAVLQVYVIVLNELLPPQAR